MCALVAVGAPLCCGDSSDEPATAATLTPEQLTPASLAPAAPSALPTAALSAAALSPGAREALSGALTRAVEQGQTPGVVALVVNRDGVLFEGVAGQRDVANQQAMSVDAIFNIASMTKPVTSVAILRLYEQGLLGLDDPVSTFLPGYDALEVLTSVDLATGEYETAPATTAMTVRHLLSHTSGIGYGFSNTTVARLQQVTQRSELELPLLNEPGAKWNYSASTRVLGLIVEAITGQSLEEYFQAQIFKPLGMTDTSYAVPTEKQARVPTLHIRAGGTLQETPQNGLPAAPTPPFTGDGGLYSTAHDYGQFMRMFLNGGALGEVRILSESSVALMGSNQIGSLFVEQQGAANPMLTQPFPLGAGQDKFGLGFQITMNADGGAAQRSTGSLAWAGLFNTEFWIDPQRGIAATLLMQVLPFYDAGAIQTLQAFESTLYQELVPQPD
jgi:CubicO group peptidase (beta-lactamase class C family)